MCTNQREIQSKYWRHKLFVSCGHCPACLQEKAEKRASRIRHESIKSKYDILFVQLDYENRFVPYILRSSLDAIECGYSDSLSVYRDQSFRLVFDRHSKSYHWKLVKNVVLDTYTIEDLRKNPNFDRCHISREFNYKYRRTSGKRFKACDDGVIPVIYYNDIQNFFKRYRIYLKRLGYDFDTKYFCCSEYGPNTDRCHHHLLLFVPKGFFSVAKMAIVASWKFCDMLRPTYKKGDSKPHFHIEEAISPSKYVSEYVNSSHHVKGILRDCNKFRPQWHYSQNFGFAAEDAFSWDSIKNKIYNGTFNYLTTISRDGCCMSELVPIPKYVVSRYFPKFKRNCLLSSSEIANLVAGSAVFKSNPQKLNDYVQSIFVAPYLSPSFIHDLLNKYSLSYDELVLISSTLSRKIKQLGVNVNEYAFLYSRAWSLYNSELLKYSQTHSTIQYQFFDNIADYVNGNLEYNDFVPPLKSVSELELDPNNFLDNLVKTDRLTHSFDQHEKTINVNSYLYG